MKKILILTLLALLMFSCNTNQKKQPLAKNGILDLRGWDFEKDGNVRLDGDWEFYCGEFLNSIDSVNYNKIKLKGILNIPGSLKGKKITGINLSDLGYASFRLKMMINNSLSNLSLLFQNSGSAYSVFVNGKKSFQLGVPGYNYKKVKYDVSIIDVVELPCKETNLELIIHVSDFIEHEIGLSKITLGLSGKLHQERENEIGINFILVGILLFLAIYHLIIFLLRRNDTANLIFASLCFFLLIMNLITGGNLKLLGLNNLFYFSPNRYTVFPAIMINLFLLFFYNIYPEVFNKRIIIFSIIIYSLLIMIKLLFFDDKSFWIFWQITSVLNLICILYVIYVIFRAFNKRLENSIIFLIGIVILFLIIIDWIFHLTGIVTNGRYFIYSMIFTQSLVLTVRFTNSFKTIERQSIELKKHKEHLEEIVEERTSRLNEQNLELSILNENLAVKNLQVESEKEISENLLLNILPPSIATRLKQGETQIADHFDEASVVFIDIVDFTKTSAGTTANRVVEILNALYTKLDTIAQKHSLEKIKTIGDCYMAAAGIPVADPDNANKAAQFALDAMNMLKDYDIGDGTILNFRCGIDCGPVVAGVIGENKFIYDVWGDMVNTASRMESNGVVGKIQVTERFKEKLFIKNEELGIKFVERGEIEIKGKGLMRTWFLTPKN